MSRHNSLDKYNPREDGLTLNDFPKMYAPVMRLAKKYGAERLITLFSDALVEAWPSDWETYNAVLKSRDANPELVLCEDHDNLIHPDPGMLYGFRLVLRIAQVH